MKENLCLGCFETEKTEGECPLCGFSHEKYEKPFDALQAGEVINDRYIVGKVLGSGGFGITYLAFDKRLYVRVAIKEYLPKSLASRELETLTIQPHSGETKDQFIHHMEQFMNEAKTLAKFKSEPGIVSIQDVVAENNTVYMIMHYVDGITLDQYVKESGGKLAVDEALSIMKNVIESLEEVHHANIIHRDISPDNIYVTPDKKVKLLDFGAARLVQVDQSQSMSVILKPGFAPVEQFYRKGKQGPWTDVYAICATIYWMLTGERPQNSIERLHEDELKDIASLGVDIPAYIEKTIMRGLTLKYSERIQSLKILDDMLFGNDETVLLSSSYDKGADQRADGSQWGGYSWLKRAVVAGALLVVVLVLGFTMYIVYLTNTAPLDISNDTLAGKSVEEDSEVNSSPSDTETETELLESIVRFEDPEIEKEIRRQVGKETEELYENDVASIQEIDLLEKETMSLEGLQYCTDLRILRLGTYEGLRKNGIEDLSPLSGLEKLDYLVLPGNQISDLSPISGKTSIKELILSGNEGITDITPLSGLSYLLRLDLKGTSLDDISAIEGMAYLTLFHISNTSIDKLDVLSELGSLKDLHVESTLELDISALDGKNIRRINFAGTDIPDMSPLREVEELWYLELDGLDENGNPGNYDWEDIDVMPVELVNEYRLDFGSGYIVYRQSENDDWKVFLDLKISDYHVSKDRKTIYATHALDDKVGPIVEINVSDRSYRYLTYYNQATGEYDDSISSYYVSKEIGLMFYTYAYQLFSMKLDGTDVRSYYAFDVLIEASEGYVVRVYDQVEDRVRYYDTQKEEFVSGRF